MYGIQIKANGEIRVREFTVDNTLEVMQSAVGGYIALQPLHSMWGGEMYANDEGIQLGLPINPLASVVAMTPILGDVFITGIADGEGYPTRVGPELIDLVSDVLNPTELERLSSAS